MCSHKSVQIGTSDQSINFCSHIFWDDNYIIFCSRLNGHYQYHKDNPEYSEARILKYVFCVLHGPTVKLYTHTHTHIYIYIYILSFKIEILQTFILSHKSNYINPTQVNKIKYCLYKQSMHIPNIILYHITGWSVSKAVFINDKCIHSSVLMKKKMERKK